MSDHDATCRSLPDRQRQILSRMAGLGVGESAQTWRLARSLMTTPQARRALSALQQRGYVRRTDSGSTYVFWALTESGAGLAERLAGESRSPERKD